MLRYPGLTPLFALMLFVEQAALFLLPRFKPMGAGSLTHVPPEAIGNAVLLPLTAAMFVCSLLRKEQKRKSRNSNPGTGRGRQKTGRSGQ